MNMLLQRSLVRSCETSHASLLIPVLRIMERITSLAASRDISCHSSTPCRCQAAVIMAQLVGGPYCTCSTVYSLTRS